jgi:ABC-type phosphate transport system substrate-binding protein
MTMKKLKSNTLIYSLLAGISLIGLSSISNAEVVVIVNPANPVSSMSAAEVTKLFTGSKTSYSDGSKAELVTNKGNVNDEFLSKVLGKTQAQLKATWSRIVFSGNGLEPKTLADNAAVKKFVANNPNGIGYIDASAVDGSVRVVLKAD